ncbi:MAG: MATE family efflux transporter, partial [Clostridiales bacterium]|nr:MATE family efflux transporter [Clostridiales bacterium]
VTGQAVAGIVPVVYFCCKNNSLLRFTKPRCGVKAFFRACTNGASELLSNISFAVVSMLYNVQLLKLAGDAGVIAFGIIMYMSTIFFNIFFGFSMGAAPPVGYHYGAKNCDELKNLRKKGFWIVGVLGVVLAALSEALASPFARIFSNTEEIFALTRDGIRLYSPVYVLMGFCVFGSAFFTALNNGLVSGAVSFLRSLVFQCGTVLLLPMFWGITGVWLAATAAEILSFGVTVLFFVLCRKKYNY